MILKLAQAGRPATPAKSNQMHGQIVYIKDAVARLRACAFMLDKENLFDSPEELCMLLSRSVSFRFLLSCAALGVISVYALPAVAADEKAKDEKPVEKAPKKSDKKAQAANPVQEWIAAENKLIDTLSAKDQRSFYVMRNKHGVIRSVRIVHRDVQNAVRACGKANPDMKAQMNDRFTQWEDAVLPVLDLADKYLKEEIDTQKVVFPSDFKHVLKLNDKAYVFGEEQIEKTPVTDKEACQGLLDSMDRTENKMVELLQDMLLPESVIRERAERAQEAEKAAEEKSEKKK